jgi:hypothetical protein
VIAAGTAWDDREGGATVVGRGDVPSEPWGWLGGASWLDAGRLRGPDADPDAIVDRLLAAVETVPPPRRNCIITCSCTGKTGKPPVQFHLELEQTLQTGKRKVGTA